ncbi:MAG: hypothetical protein E6Q43_07125 [Dokdonella sp.]|nr:MAG: hypothetical protein EYC71_10910 [Gammaproteobacteria bacterium]TXI71983.1 MAG: hypothetical protein E6Q43_07125 [Dokdonella sp.]
MNAPKQLRVRGSGLLLLGLLAALPAQAGGERIFDDGFDPCCQIGGAVAGTTGSGLVLHLAAGSISEDRSISHDGLYRFAASVPNGTAYTVSIDSQPNGQSCGLANASGSMGNSDIDNVDVSCAATPALIWDQGNWGDLWQ